MNKLTKIGLNAMVVFTMMFATTVVVAQEKVGGSDNVEVKASVESKKVYAVVNPGFIGKTELTKTIDPQVKMASPVSFSVEFLESPAEPENWTMTPALSCDAGNNLCGISFDEEEYELDENDKPNEDVLEAVSQHWSSTPHGQTIPNTNIIVYKRT